MWSGRRRSRSEWRGCPGRWGPEGWGPDGWSPDGPRRVGAPKGWGGRTQKKREPKGGGPKGGARSLRPKGGGRSKGGRSEISRFFPSPATIFALFVSFWWSFRGILVFLRPGPVNVHVWALGLSYGLLQVCDQLQGADHVVSCTIWCFMSRQNHLLICRISELQGYGRTIWCTSLNCANSSMVTYALALSTENERLQGFRLSILTAFSEAFSPPLRACHLLSVP